MPTYDYECEACGHAFELFQSMSAPVKRKCPECAEPKLRRLIGRGAAVMFKGSGFYETDYKRTDGGEKAESTSTKKADGDAAKAEPKPSKRESPDPPAKSG